MICSKGRIGHFTPEQNAKLREAIARGFIVENGDSYELTQLGLIQWMTEKAMGQ